MILVDVHAHLDHPLFENDLDEVISRAEAEGVKIIITQGVNYESNQKAIELSKKYPLVRAALGLYPLDAKNLNPEKLLLDEADGDRERTAYSVDETIAQIKAHKKEIIAIGEVGLDFKYCQDPEEIEKQISNFKKIIRLSKELKKPLIIHSRKAEEKVLDLLEEEKISPELVVLHCFSGKKKLIKRASEKGYYFSIPTNIDRSQHFQMMASMININQLLTETDAPYLAPNRAPRNEPKNIIYTVRKIAEIKGMVDEEVANNIFMNYQRIF